jgi:hypothetical protein
MPGFGRGPPGPPEPDGRWPPGRGGWPAPGRGVCGRGAAWPPTPNGLLATRGPLGRGAAGRGPGVGRVPVSSTGTGACAAAGAAAAAGWGSGARTGAGAGAAAAAGAWAGDGAVGAAGAAGLVATLAGFAAGADAAAGNASRSRRATGASTVDDALLTNSPSSLSFARTSLLGTPSSLASSCTRALPATGLLRTEPAVARRSRFRWETQSSLALHRGLIALLLTLAFASVGSVAFASGNPVSDCSREKTTPICLSCRMPRTGGPQRVAASTCRRSSAGSSRTLLRNARPNARRRSARATQDGSGCTQAPRPAARALGSGSTSRTGEPAGSRRTSGPATTRSKSVAGARRRQPTHVRKATWALGLSPSR